MSKINKTKLIGTMIVTTLLFFSILIYGVQSSANDNPKQLKLVHVIVRHGIRTPADTYPNDPYINNSFSPIGWGQLTNPGKLELYNLGKYLRKRYDNFLGSKYDPTLAYTQSTDVDRTKASLQLINAGLFPPDSEQKWGPIDWQPIPVHAEPLDQDNLLLVRRPCPKYHQLFDELQASAEIKNKLDSNADLFTKLTEITGKQVKNFDDVQDIYSTLKAEESFNLTLPDWTKEYYPNQLEELATFSYVLNAYNDNLNRLKGGVLLKKLLKDWTDKQSNKLTNKFYLYGGHDSTIANILSTLKVWDPQIPGYAITILFELSQDAISKEFGLEVYLKNSTTSNKLYQLTIPNCETFCSIAKLVKLTQNVIPDNWEKECQADYQVPELGGP